MIRKSFWLAAVVSGAAFAGVAGTASAQPADMPPPPPHGMMHEHHPFGPDAFAVIPLLHGVNLTPDQEKQIHEIMKSAHHPDRESWDKMKGLHQQIEALLFAPGKVDQAKLTALTQQIDAIHAQEDADHIAVAVKVHDVLTPEQLQLAQQNNARIDSLEQQLAELTRPPHQHGVK